MTGEDENCPPNEEVFPSEAVRNDRAKVATATAQAIGKATTHRCSSACVDSGCPVMAAAIAAYDANMRSGFAKGRPEVGEPDADNRTGNHAMRTYVAGLEKALREIADIGNQGVQMYGYPRKMAGIAERALGAPDRRFR